jgi:Fur family transcriptional regulator, ferric uptake regulator
MTNKFDIENHKDIRFTPSRLHIIELLKTYSKPICYDDIKDSLKMDKTTFYRNISDFEQKNMINIVQLNNKRYFEINQKDNHFHFVCTTCENIICMKKENLNIAIKNHKIDSVIINGKCNNCI